MTPSSDCASSLVLSFILYDYKKSNKSLVVIDGKAEEKECFGGEPTVKRPMRITALRWASLVLAGSGLVLLWLWSVHREIPVVRIERIHPKMNFATVQVQGTVVRDAYRFDSGGFVFNLDDGSGSLAVFGSRTQAEQLIQSGRLPRRGDRVVLSGNLSVDADREPTLRLLSAEHLQLERRRAPSLESAPLLDLSSVTESKAGSIIEVAGQLESIDIPAPGSRAPYVLTLEQDGTLRPVVFWNDVLGEMDGTLPVPGSVLKVRGRVGVYRDEVQIKVRAADDLQIMEKPGASD